MPWFFTLWFLLIKFQCIIVIIKCLFVLTDFIETGSASEQSIYMCRIQFDDYREIFNGDLDISYFFISTANNIVSSNISFIYIEQSIAIFDGFLI